MLFVLCLFVYVGHFFCLYIFLWLCLCLSLICDAVQTILLSRSTQYPFFNTGALAMSIFENLPPKLLPAGVTRWGVTDAMITSVCRPELILNVH